MSNIPSEYEECEVVEDKNLTCNEVVDMDVSVLVQNYIQTNIDAAEIRVERCLPKQLLLPTGYHESIFDDDIDEHVEVANRRRLIVDEDCLLSLFIYCFHGCGSEITSKRQRYLGTTLVIDSKCESGHTHQWASSTSTRGVHSNNLIAAAAILFSGNNFQKIDQLFKIMSVKFICRRTFETMQRKYLYPSIDEYYLTSQKIIFGSLKDTQCIVAGDGQMDSPGFCAKQCVYSIMDTVNYYILHIENVDVRESSLKSTVMEKIGCSRALRYLMTHITIAEFVSDSNSQIIKMIRKLNIVYLNTF